MGCVFSEEEPVRKETRIAREQQDKQREEGVMQVRSGTLSSAGRWARMQKASVDTETTPH